MTCVTFHHASNETAFPRPGKLATGQFLNHMTAARYFLRRDRMGGRETDKARLTF